MRFRFDVLSPWASDVITEVKFLRHTLVFLGVFSKGEWSSEVPLPSKVVAVNLGMRFICDVSKCFIFVILEETEAG